MDIVDHLLSRQVASEFPPIDAPPGQRVASGAGELPSGVTKGLDAGNAGDDDVISKATFGLYKVALLTDFREKRDRAETRYDAQLLQAAIDRLEATSCSGFAKRGRHTSALKAKKFSDRDYQAVMEDLAWRIESGTNHWANSLRTFLRANRIAGLRPSEWEYASVQEAKPGSESLVLVVHNAKHTNGRGNGPIRVIELDGLPADDLDALHEMVQLVEAVESGAIAGAYRRDGAKRPISGYADMVKQISHLLYDITREIFPANTRRKTWPTLYSLRHQVAADAKKSGSKEAVVAALLGHASDATAGQHYGRRVSGQRPVQIKPAASNVATVRAKAKRFTPAPGGAG